MLRRPFHESIVDAIRTSGCTGLSTLLPLIRRTKIPKNHDAIAEALKEEIERYKAGDTLDLDGNSKASILDEIEEQKKEAATAKKSEDEKKSVNLDDLQGEIEKSLGLLSDRHPGLSAWNGCLHDRLQELHKLTSQALGK